MTWGVHISLATRWLDPGEAEGVITPFMVLYALHDALVKPLPELGPIHAAGPRAEQAGFGLIPGFPYSARSRRSGSRSPERESPAPLSDCRRQVIWPREPLDAPSATRYRGAIALREGGSTVWKSALRSFPTV